MFLQKYVQEVDEQLSRLMAVREKIAALAGPAPEYKVEFNYTASLPGPADVEAQPVTPSASQVQAAEPAAAEATIQEAAEIVAAPAKRRGRPKGSRNKTTMIRTRRTAAPEPRALASTVPTGPVFISPAQLTKRHEAVASVAVVAPPAPKEERAGGGLDALIRELTERRATIFSPAA